MSESESRRWSHEELLDVRQRLQGQESKLQEELRLSADPVNGKTTFHDKLIKAAAFREAMEAFGLGMTPTDPWLRELYSSVTRRGEDGAARLEGQK